LHEKFAWLPKAAEAGEYFKPAEDVQFELLISESTRDAFVKE
jgi:hypothetical protein